MKTIAKAFAVAALTFGALAAHAGTTSINFESSADKSIKKLGSFSGAATYDDVAGLLTVTINNTSSATGVRLTGMAFNVAGSGAAAYRDGDVAGTPGDEDLFDDARAKKGKRLIKAKPLGNFEAGAGINGKFNPPGKKLASAAGIAAGAGRTFTFDVSGGAGLTAADFIGGDMGLVAAFRGKKPDKVGSVVVAGTFNQPAADGNNDDDGDPGIIDLPEIVPPVIPPVIITGVDNRPGTITGGNTGGTNGQPAAVPLPPAAIPAIATIVAFALPKLRRTLRERA